MTTQARAPATVEARAHEEGIALFRGGRLMRTPEGHALVVPSKALAAAIAAEWNETPSPPRRRLLTKLTATAIDRVRTSRAGVEAQLVDFARTDLLCYRVENNPALAAREAAAWDPLLDWAAEALGARLHVTQGVTPVPQPEAALDAIKSTLAREGAFALVALQAAAALMSSLVLAFALARGRCSADEAWAAATIDETWQTERWGEDAEAAARAKRCKAELHALERFLALIAEGT
jgi:chaperone required for assembly of F1-ATPase